MSPACDDSRGHESHDSAIAALDKAQVSRQHPPRGSYPPISSIPPTSPERLARAAEAASEDAKQAPNTILYLAYGSNMSAETFLGMRRIRPLSKVNVSAPSLRLTFDLPGFPYQEPCFANVGFRHVPDKPSFESEWDGGLVGVVYEVTEKDYRNIMKTEGAGASYEEIVVPCTPIPIPASVEMLGTSPLASHPRPFFARTLYAPCAPVGKEPGKGSCLCRLPSGAYRPDPNYAQASARYLKLLKDGAREHELPDVYQRYLASLQPYAITTTWQKIGQFLFTVLWVPQIVFFFGTTRLVADETGKIPKGLAAAVKAMAHLMWASYDGIFKRVFGDGEKTLGADVDNVRRGSDAVGAADEQGALLQQREERN